MTDIKNVLFPTDFSEDSRNALNFALEIARVNGATLHIMHSIEEPYDFAPMVENIGNSLTQRVEKLFDNIVKDIKKDNKYGKIDINMQMQNGRALYTILEETRNQDIDMIVMGAKGRTGLEKLFFGSTSAEVIQRSKVPVLTVPKEASYDGFKKIIFATDYQKGDIKALQFVTELADQFDSEIKIFHSSLENDLKTDIMFRGFKEIVNEAISYRNIDFDHDTTLSFFDAILNRMTEDKVSLLVMTRYQQSLSLFKKKQSKEMSHYTVVPLLVLPGNKIAN